MDVKILPWKEGTIYTALNDTIVLCIEQLGSVSKDIETMLPFKRVNYSIYNTKTKTLEKILPDVEKYMVAEFKSAIKNRRLLYFYHIEYPSYPMATFMMFEYDIEAHICRKIYQFDDNLKNYEQGMRRKIFILNDQYLLSQVSNIRSDGFKSVLYDTKNKIRYDILDERFTKSGIYQMLPIANNVCAIRFGHNQLENDRLIPIEQKDCAKESITLISISQFIADVLLKIKIISAEIIDEVYVEKTFSDIQKVGKYIVFSRIDRINSFQEIFFYQYITKETSLLLNNNVYNPNNIFPCVMDGRPIVVRRTKKYYEFNQIRNNKLLLRLPSNNKILFCDQDFLVVKNTKKRLFSGKKEQKCEIYQFSTMKRMYKDNAKPKKFLLLNKDSLIIYMEEQNT